MSKRDEVPGLPEQLRLSREKSGLTQVQASERSGVPQTNISIFERGTRTPTLATLYKLADAYGVEVADLLPPRTPPSAPEPVPEPPKKARKKS